MSGPRIPWDEIDPEIRPLVRLLNDQPGVKTLHSCAGHEEESMPWRTLGYVSFVVDSLNSLNALIRAIGKEILNGYQRGFTCSPVRIAAESIFRTARMECHELANQGGPVFTLNIVGNPLWAQREALHAIEAALSSKEAER